MALYRPFIITTIIAVLMLAGGRFGLMKPLTSAFSSLIQPVLAAETSATRKSFGFFGIIAEMRTIYSENNELRKKTAELEAELSNLKEVKHENDILRQELKFAQESTDEYIPAQLIGRTSTGVIKDLIINRGTKDALRGGQAVIAQGYLVGTIATVSVNQSTVMLLTNPRSMLPIVTQDSRATGILRGGISGLSATDVLIDADIKTGENIVTSGLGGEMPSGIPVGKIIDITSRKGDITKKAGVRSPLDLGKLEMVFIRKVSD